MSSTAKQVVAREGYFRNNAAAKRAGLKAAQAYIEANATASPAREIEMTKFTAGRQVTVDGKPALIIFRGNGNYVIVRQNGRDFAVAISELH